AELLRHSYWADAVNMDDVQIRVERLANQMDSTAVTELMQLVEISQ
ncbi:MAG: hypothetical protein HC804_02035, partial [Anaerolineae bacterium]|nr:hypothetical protein [Anaerolineae bacterium]